jgi:hypothetical protein
MPKFTELNPADVVLGRGIATKARREPFIAAVTADEAGAIELERGESKSQVKRDLAFAAKAAGVRVRSSWVGDRTLVWKRYQKAS